MEISETAVSGAIPVFAFSAYYIGAAAVVVGVAIITVTRWIEHRRSKDPMPHLVPTTPFMMAGILVLLLALGFLLNLWRSTPRADLNARANKIKSVLTTEEIAQFKAQLGKCWVPQSGIAEGEVGNVLIRIFFHPDGRLNAPPELIQAPASRSGPAVAENAIRAVQRCQPYDALPAKKYEAWRIIDLIVSPHGLFEVLPASGYEFHSQ
jgi:hypothetical protein